MSEMPSHFVTVCPKCLVDLRVPISYSGSNVRCKHCEHKFRVFVPDHLMTPSSDEFHTGSLNDSGSAAERIDIVCPNCSASLSVRGVYAGRHVQCERCEHKFLVKKIEVPLAQIGHADPESNLLDRFHGQPEGPRSTDAEPRPAEQRPESAGELAAIREENERLAARLETLQQDHAGIQSERDSLQVQLEQFRGDHDRLQSEHEQARQEHQRMRDELASIRDALGGLSPSEIVVLRDERQSLGDENQQLRDQVKSLQTELSSSLGLAQIVADREEELRLARLQAEDLNQRIEHLDDRLNGVHGEREQLGEQLRDLQAQLSNMEAQRDELNERIADHAQALDASHVRSDQLAEQLRQRDNELATKLDELERLAALRQTDAAEADELRGTLARREQELQQKCEELRGQIDELHRTLVSAEQAHGDERSRLDEQHQLTREVLESARSEIGVLQARLSELLDLHDKLKADHLKAIEAQRFRLGAEFPADLEAERSRHAEQIAELHARAEANAQLVERLKAEILTIAQSRSAPDADLEAAREEIADLRAKLADTETTKRSISSVLEGMGIRLH